MHLTSSPVGPAVAPEPPARWARWWTSPLARLEYGPASRVPLWAEATLPAQRTLTGALRPALQYAGGSLDAAIDAARQLAASPVEIEFSYRNGRIGRTQVNPAIAVLRDARQGAFFVAPLLTTVRRGDEWLDAVHSIDGPAFDGRAPLLASPRVLSASRDLVAVVGARALVRPEPWTDAPDDSRP